MYTYNVQQRALYKEQSLENAIPVVDFSGFNHGVANERLIVAYQVLTSLSDSGAVMLVNHGISEQLLSQTFNHSKEFFSLPSEVKRKYAYSSAESNRGYLAVGQEKVHKDMPDQKETFEIGKDGEAGLENPWPQELDTFRAAMLQYFQAMDNLHLSVLKCIELALGLEPESLTSRCNAQHENLRLLHYPSTTASSIDVNKRTGEHTDYGTLTLLTQDQVGGLQVKLQNGQWIDVQPVKGAVIVHVGDMLQRWTNDMLPAPRHKVIQPKAFRTATGSMVPERYSIAFFCNPNKDVLIDALPGTFTASNPKKYKPFNALDFLNMRLKATL